MLATVTASSRRPLLLVTSAHPSLLQHTLPEGDGWVHPNLGRLIQPRHTSSIERTAQEGIPWAADNDCFQGLTEAPYVRMLERIAGLPGCLFVTVPDVVGDPHTTLQLFEEWAPRVRAYGLPLALVAQDGLELRAQDIPWPRINALFMGGSTEWKESPAARWLAGEARARGRWVHWGRVNTHRRYKLVVEEHGDSWDGSKWARFRKTYLDKGLEWARYTAMAREAREEG